MVYRGLKREDFLGWGAGEGESGLVGFFELGRVGGE